MPRCTITLSGLLPLLMLMVMAMVMAMLLMLQLRCMQNHLSQ
jgi:hypothetical protein